VAAPLAGRWSDRFPTAWLCTAGALALAIGLGLCGAWTPHGAIVWPVVFTTLSGLGFGFFQTPNNRNLLMSAPRHRSGAAGGMQATARLTGQTLGSLVVGMLFTVLPGGQTPRLVLGLAALLAAGAACVSWQRRPPSAAS